MSVRPIGALQTYSPALWQTLLIVLMLLVFSTVLAWLVRRNSQSVATRELFAHIIERINAWWVMVAVLVAAFLGGQETTLLLFFGLSVMALREYLQLVPSWSHNGQYKKRIIAAILMVAIVQYGLIYDAWYNMFVIFIPVYAFIVFPIIMVLSGHTEGFLSRTAILHWGLMLCVYAVSYLPALLILPIDGWDSARNIELVVYFVLLVQLSDVLQFVFGKWLGRTPLSPQVSPNKTWEGLIGGVVASVMMGVLLRGLTPFNATQAVLVVTAVLLAGVAGGLCMSAVKRDSGVKDFGQMIQGHGGVMDRLDSVVFSAPLFFHITRYWFTS